MAAIFIYSTVTFGTHHPNNLIIPDIHLVTLLAPSPVDSATCTLLAWHASLHPLCAIITQSQRILCDCAITATRRVGLARKAGVLQKENLKLNQNSTGNIVLCKKYKYIRCHQNNAVRCTVLLYCL